MVFFSKYAYAFPIKSKKIQDIKPCFQKIFKKRKPKFIWSDQESAFFSKEMLKFFEDHNIKIYYTHSNLKSVIIEKPKYKINDLARISLKRRQLFDKPSGNIKWCEELFKIYKINKSNVITYQLKDMNDEIIKGQFYEKELQLTKNTTGEYIIEKILKTNKDKIYVKWRGYSNNFNSWVDKNSVTKYV